MKTLFAAMLIAVLSLGLVGCPDPQTAGSSSTGNNGTNTGTN